MKKNILLILLIILFNFGCEEPKELTPAEKLMILDNNLSNNQ